MTVRRALADTSVSIGLESARFNSEQFADFEWGVSAITLGELRLGVLRAQDPGGRIPKAPDLPACPALRTDRR